MTLKQIVESVLSGKRVYWSSNAYEVKLTPKGNWMIVCLNGYCFDLADKDGNLECKEEDFYTN
jgi:hypothetical protein